MGMTAKQSLKQDCRNSEHPAYSSRHTVCAKLLYSKRSTEEIPVGTFYALQAVGQKQDDIGWQSLELEGSGPTPPSLRLVQLTVL
jgi:hypothetical protein